MAADKLEEYGLTEQIECLIDLELGDKYVKDLLAWDDESPPAWAEMALAYARLAFVKGYQLRRDEGKDGRIRRGKTFAKTVKDMGRPFAD